MSIHKRARVALGAGLTVALLLPMQAATAESHGGGGQPSDSTGSVYSDLVVALRAEDGTPILQKYVPADEESEATTEYCVHPVSYEPVPGVAATTNPLDGREVWVLPLQGEWLPPYDGDVPVEEIEPCDPKPNYAMFVTETELERLNLARTSDDVIADKLAAVEEKLVVADEVTLDGAGRITTDGASLDASPEFAAMYQSLMTTGTIPGLREGQAGPPAQVGIFDAWKLAAAAIGTAAGKEVPITVDTVEYYNRVIGFPESEEYVSPWGVEFLRSENPDQPGTPMAEGEQFVDYSAFTYNRSETFVGSVTWLDVPSMTWKVSRVADVIPFTQLTADPIGSRTLTGVTAFAQLADDVRAAILYYHNHETIPGFYIDPVGVDTTAAQERAITDPEVDLGELPAQVFQTQPFQLTATLLNPWGGERIERGRLRVTVDAAEGLAASDVVATAVDGGEPVPFTAVDGNLTGWWGPNDGFPVPPGYRSTTAFDVTIADGTPLGAHDVQLELVDLDTGETRATDTDAITVSDNVPTVGWADEIYPLVEQGTPFQVPATVYAPTAGEADVTVALAGPGDDPSTDLIEALEDGDVKAYASDGNDMVAMPMSLDDQGRLTGRWHMTLTAGFNPVTWYVTVAEGALVGSYTVDVSLDGGNTVEPVTISVAASEEHGQKPPGAGEDTTAPVVTITPVGALGSDAAFTLSANEPDVTYQVRLVTDDVPGSWEPATEEGKSYTDLSPGIYAFHAKGTDAAGNVSGMYSKTWVVASPPEAPKVPTTKLIAGPNNNSWVLGRRTTLRVSSNVPSASYIVTLNGRNLGTRSGPRIVVRGLWNSTNRITVRAVANGLVDQTPVVRTVNVPRSVADLPHTRRWHMRKGDRHLHGAFAETRRHGQRFKAYGGSIKRVALVVSKGPRNGKIHVFLNGKRLTRSAVRLGAHQFRPKVNIPIETFHRPKRGVITVKVVSRGKLVRLEGIGIARR